MDGPKLPNLSVENLSNKLSSSLPVFISADNLKDKPDLCHLLEDLCTNHLTPKGVTLETNTRLVQTTHTMNQAKKNYLYSATLNIMAKSTVEKGGNDSRDTKLLKEMKEALTLAELHDCVQLCDSQHASGVPLLGVSPDILTSEIMSKITPKHLQVFYEHLEENVEDLWLKLATLVSTKGFRSYDPQDIFQIPDDLKQRKLEIEHKKMSNNNLQTDLLFQQVYRQYVEYGYALFQIVEDHRLSRHLNVYLENLTMTLKAQLLKLKSLYLDIECKTYNKETVAEFTNLHIKIQAKIEEAKTRIAELDHQLSAYSGLGPDFNVLLEEYTHLQEDINFTKLLSQKHH